MARVREPYHHQTVSGDCVILWIEVPIGLPRSPPQRAQNSRALGDPGSARDKKTKCYNPCVLQRGLILTFLLAGAAHAQQAPSPAQTPADQQASQPQVKINVMNVCTPGKDDQELINRALAVLPAKPEFTADFEISRGHTILKTSPDANFVRLRRDYVAESPLMTAQYSISTDASNTIETLVLRMRDPKELYEIIMEDRVSAGAAAPATVVSADTPPSRVRIERLGKNAAGVTRCQEIDQSAYEPVFRRAAEIMAQYRAAMGLRTTFRSDIAWLNGKSGASGPPKKQSAKKR